MLIQHALNSSRNYTKLDVLNTTKMEVNFTEDFYLKFFRYKVFLVMHVCVEKQEVGISNWHG